MIRVGVLRGGTGNHYEQSLASGAHVLKHLPRDTYQVVDIFIDRDGHWHAGGVPITPDKLPARVDAVWNALHGFYGEDGQVQRLLADLNIPYTGSSPLVSAMLANHKTAKETFAGLGIKTPQAVYVEQWGNDIPSAAANDVALRVFQKFSPPWIVRPLLRAYSSEPIVCKTRGELSALLGKMCQLGIPVMIEEKILGREVSAVVMPNFRGKKNYTFIPVHIENPRVRLRAEDSAKLQQLAWRLHEELGLGQYSRMHAIMTRKGHLYVLDIQTVPYTQADAELNHSLESVGASFEEFEKHLLGEALKGK